MPNAVTAAKRRQSLRIRTHTEGQRGADVSKHPRWRAGQQVNCSCRAQRCFHAPRLRLLSFLLRPSMFQVLRGDICRSTEDARREHLCLERVCLKCITVALPEARGVRSEGATTAGTGSAGTRASLACTFGLLACLCAEGRVEACELRTGGRGRSGRAAGRRRSGGRRRRSREGEGCHTGRSAEQKRQCGCSCIESVRMRIGTGHREGERRGHGNRRAHRADATAGQRVVQTQWSTSQPLREECTDHANAYALASHRPSFFRK